MLEGSCACGRVRYVIRGELVGPIHHCHCWRCRKHSGASFGTTVPIRAEDLELETPESELGRWESSPGIHRFFARCCGSPLYKRTDAVPQVLGFRLGTLDVDPGRKVERHFHLGSKAPWIEIEDSLPQETGGAPFPTRD